MTTLVPVTEMQKAFLAGDRSYDGLFFVGVRTTRIFCRPSCPSRKPLPENVEYFAAPADALQAGYRPCKRCEPMLADGTPPEWVNRLLEVLDRDPGRRFTDDDLRALGIHPARARRYFATRYGMTFQAYCRQRRLARAQAAIREGGELNEAWLESGFESLSGFREAFGKLFERTPGQARSAECLLLRPLTTPLGPMVAAANREGICLLEFSDRHTMAAQTETLRRWFPVPAAPGTNGYLERLTEELAAYFEGKLTRFTVPLIYPGTPFQVKIWDLLREIPYGETRSYEDLARQAGTAGAVRAVGTTNGRNRIAILIPCHRVVNKSGELGGYGGGLWRKRLLLALEGGESDLPLRRQELRPERP